jgi:hypothetical protein
MTEYEQWKNDPVAQQEYKDYLLEEVQKTEPIPIYFTQQLTRNFNEIFKEKS